MHCSENRQIPYGTSDAITTDRQSHALRGGYNSACATFDHGLYCTVLDAQWGSPVVSITNAVDALLESLTLTHGDGS